ncbi:MAG: hypothetical protein ACU0BN_07255 [Sulfitobacter sp.]
MGEDLFWDFNQGLRVVTTGIFSKGKSSLDIRQLKTQKLGTVVAVLFACLASQAFAADAAVCDLPEGLSSSIETGTFIVGTYHKTGIPGSERVIQVHWPKSYKLPVSGTPTGRTDGAEAQMSFAIPRTVLNQQRSGSLSAKEKVEVPEFSLLVGNGAEAYPLYSSLGLIGAMPRHGSRELLTSPQGTTYHSSEGFKTFPEEDHGDWVRYAYPGRNRVSNDSDTFFRGSPSVGSVHAIMRCNRWPEGPTRYSQCQVFKKIEPVFYSYTIDGRSMAAFPAVEIIADRLMECILGVNKSG